MWATRPMKRLLFSIMIVLCMLPSYGVFAQAPLPAIDFRSISSLVERDFESVDNIYAVGMTDDPDARFDLIVVGSMPRNDGWRVEVISVRHHKVATIWDSAIAATEPQYSNSGPKSVTFKARDYDYDIFIETCAQHLCHDGVSGFIAFLGKSEKAVTATVVTQGLDKPPSGMPKYDVTFSENADHDSKAALERAICQSRTLSNKSGFPFSCKDQ